MCLSFDMGIACTGGGGSPRASRITCTCNFFDLASSKIEFFQTLFCNIAGRNDSHLGITLTHALALSAHHQPNAPPPYPLKWTWLP